MAGIALAAAAFLSWTGCQPNKEIFERYPDVSYDDATGTVWCAYLHLDIEVDPVDDYLAQTVDSIYVESRTADTPWSAPADVSAGQVCAKMGPEIAARGDEVWVVWAGQDPGTGVWDLYAALRTTGGWRPPVNISNTPAMEINPSLAIDPVRGRVWVAYERWSDNSICARFFDGSSWSGPARLSEGGRGNYRPRIIATDPAGPNAGEMIVLWDGYRDLNYDLYLRRIAPDLSLSLEERITFDGRWDSQGDVMEDGEGNLWVAWVKMRHMEDAPDGAPHNMWRDVHVMVCQDGRWRYTNLPPDETIPGKVSEDAIVQAPRLVRDEQGKICVVWKDASALPGALPFPWVNRLAYRIYTGASWGAVQVQNGSEGVDDVFWNFSPAVVGGRRVLGRAEVFSLVRTPASYLVDLDQPLPETPADELALSEGSEPVHPLFPVRRRFEPRKRITAQGTDYELYMGDTHTHSQVSDGNDPLDMNYNYARDVARLDYYAATDHDYPHIYTPGEEAYVRSLCRAFASEDFITLDAYEWTSFQYGHRVVLYEGDRKPKLPCLIFHRLGNPLAALRVEDLYRFIESHVISDGTRVMLSAHNMVNVGADFSTWDPSLEPLFDIASAHSQAETSETPAKGDRYYSMQQLLDGGFTVGTFGNTDIHEAAGIGMDMSGAYLEAFTREGLFDALHARRTLAMHNSIGTEDLFSEEAGYEFPTLFLHFAADNRIMGSEYSKVFPPELHVEAEAMSPIDRLTIVRDGSDVLTRMGYGESSMTVDWMDAEWGPGRHYYYIRVTLDNGHKGYSSPIFVNRVK